MRIVEKYDTTREIWQQPRLWRETVAIIRKNKERIREFLDRAAGNGPLRVVLTGAGSSAFVGASVAPYLNRVVGYQVESVATTDIVSNPLNYLPDVPTLLVSCARSGNSPESVATVALANQLVSDLHHIVLTCNPEGSLTLAARGDENTLVLLMPRDANDVGFAMTGSFTTMVLACLLMFDLDRLEDLERQVKQVSLLGEKILEQGVIQDIARDAFQRAVFLGSSTLNGLARESALKMLELTTGKVVATADSALGFRHGPKSVINEHTMVFSFLSQDAYARHYELDLLREMAGENGTINVALLPSPDSEVAQLADYTICVSETAIVLEDDVFLLFPYVLFAQALALYKSVELGINPDDPSPDGIVNRVVQGVNIYPFEEEKRRAT